MSSASFSEPEQSQGGESTSDSHQQDSRSGVEDLRPIIERALADAAQLGDGCPEHLATAIRYALLAPGKRLRPALVLMSAEACGGAIDEALPGAVAVEMIHAYSLIHDDLPAMDDDDIRRGRPTVHIAFDEATAILAGDALQPLAFQHLSENISDPARAVEAIRLLATAAGPEKLVGGQADDLAADSASKASMQAKPEDCEGKPEPHSDQMRNSEIRTVAHLESIHRRKTGALFTASLELGAVLSGASQASREAVTNYASDLGLAFQVVDDVLDHVADESSLGKRVGKDASRGKLTYPGLLGIDAAREKADQLVQSAKAHVLLFGDAAWRLNWLADYVHQRTH